MSKGYAELSLPLAGYRNQQSRFGSIVEPAVVMWLQVSQPGECEQKVTELTIHLT